MLGSWQGVNGRKKVENPDLVDAVKTKAKQQVARMHFCGIFIRVNFSSKTKRKSQSHFTALKKIDCTNLSKQRWSKVFRSNFDLYIDLSIDLVLSRYDYCLQRWRSILAHVTANPIRMNDCTHLTKQPVQTMASIFTDNVVTSKAMSNRELLIQLNSVHLSVPVERNVKAEKAVFLSRRIVIIDSRNSYRCWTMLFEQA